MTPTQSVSTSYSKPPCPVCQGDHPAYFCPAFLAKNMEQRQEIVTQLHLCRNCLKSGHAAASCRSDYRCRTCRGRHNTTLHYDSGNSQVHTTAVVATVAGKRDKKSKTPLLMTCKVLLSSPTGRTVVARALLDSGAAVSLMTQSTRAALQLEATDEKQNLSGVEDTPTSKGCPVVNCMMAPVHRSKNQVLQLLRVLAHSNARAQLQSKKTTKM